MGLRRPRQGTEAHLVRSLLRGKALDPDRPQTRTSTEQPLDDNNTLTIDLRLSREDARTATSMRLVGRAGIEPTTERL